MRRKYGSYLELRGEQARRRSGSLKRSQRRPPGDPGSTATNRVIPSQATTTMNTLRCDKAALRATQRTSREARTLGEQRSASLKIAALLSELLPRLGATKVAGFSAIRGEVSLDPVFEAAGHLEWYLPKVIERGDALAFGRWTEVGLETGAYGILEPQGPYVSLQALDIALVPGLAFTRHGHRLGMGGGFYDRSLIGYGGIAIGVAYDEDVVEAIPVGQHDCLVDYLVTPSGWQKCQT